MYLNVYKFMINIYRFKYIKSIYWYLWKYSWLPISKELRNVILQIPTTFIGYDFTFSNGKNVWDTIGGAREKKLSPIFINDGDESQGESDIYSDTDDNDDNGDNGDDYKKEITDNKNNNTDEDEDSDDLYMIPSDTESTADTVISSLSADIGTLSINDNDKNKNKNKTRKKSKKQQQKKGKFKVIKKRSVAKIDLQYLVTGSDMEFVYDIIWYPGIIQNLSNFTQFYSKFSYILLQFV